MPLPFAQDDPVLLRLPDGSPTPEADLRYWSNFFDLSTADLLMRQLAKEVSWKHEPIRLFGKEVMQPRLTALAGDKGLVYGYSGISMEAPGWHGAAKVIKEKVEAATNTVFNLALLNYYRDGQDSMSWHSDDEAELGRNPVIASVTLGARRKFRLRHKSRKDCKLDLWLEHGSLLLMAGPTQHGWQHAIPKTKAKLGARINLTFRCVIQPKPA